VNPEKIRSHKAFEKRWYYRIELAPGLYTPGNNRRPVALTRELLRRVDIESGGAGGGGARCLDVGIQEGLVTILIARRGASEVVAYDRALRMDQLSLAQRALGVDFDLIGDVKLQDLPRALAAHDRDPFDVVVFSGVLYHMFDPLGGLAVVRGMVREGGICLIETSVAVEDSYSMHFNHRGRFTPGASPRFKPSSAASRSTFWLITPRCLDYLLRFLRLKPIDLVCLPVSDALDGKPAQARLAVACRAVAEAVAEPGDEWISESQQQKGRFAEFLDWDAVASAAAPIGYDDSRDGLVRSAGGSVDLHESIEAAEPLSIEREQTCLTLDARF
jgi:SAM-dependent methyltransferase